MDIIKENKLMPYNYDTVNELYGITPTASEVTGFVNAGLGIINYVGHGAVTEWVTSEFTNTNVSGLTNGSKLPFLISVACVNGDFDGNTCFGEAWLRKSGGGAVAAIMSSINQPWDQPMIAQDYNIQSGNYSCYRTGECQIQVELYFIIRILLGH